ncbi:MAG: sulfatase [Planctomycetota bacterium]
MAKVVVIMCDTLRRDYMGCYGNQWIHTPFFDKLAEKAYIFDNAYISAFPTIPNRTDLFLGKYTFPFYGWQALDRKETPVAAALTGAGVVTQFIHDTMHMLNNGNFFARGFRGWKAIRGGESDLFETLANVEIKLQAPDEKHRGDGHAAKQYLRNRHHWTTESDWFVAQTATECCTWLERNYKAKDFFLWIDTFQIHEPWDPPQWYIDRYDPDFKGEVNIHPRYDYCDYLTKPELRQAIARYAGEVTLTDRWVGNVIQKVEDLGIDGETIIMLTSDHGMYLGEHGRIGKHTVVHPEDPWPLYDTVAKIPWIIKVPGITRAKRINSLVQPPDMMPTLLDIFGARGPAGMHGKSLMPLLNGKRTQIRKYAFSGGQMTGKPGILHTPITVTGADGWTLIFGHPEDPPELYHTAKDPEQKRNIIKQNLARARTMHRAFEHFLFEINAPDEAVQKCIQHAP